MKELDESKESWLCIGVLVFGLICFLLTKGCVSAYGAELRLPVVEGANWHTTLYLSLPLDSAASAPYSISYCGYGPSGVTGSVVPGGAVKFPKFGELICAQPFGTIPPVAGLQNLAQLSFDDGTTHASYALPPLGGVGTEPQRFGPVSNDATTYLTINTFPMQYGELEVVIYDGANKVIGVERYVVAPPVNQYHPVTQFSVGSIEIRIPPLQVGVGGTVDPLPIYGFVANASPRGDNAIVYPFK